ncbi:MAG: sensor histidine kinase [Sphingomicrobium sp.]
MRFDDRLLTVLNQPSGDRHDSAVRWRQLVDLVARAGANSASPVVGDALDVIRADAAKVDDHLRAAAARAVAALPLPLALLEYFASDGLAVSAPVLAAATLDPAQWRALLAIADDETRQFIETLHPELGSLPPPDLTEQLIEPEAEPEPAPAAPSAPAGPSLHEVVARIERRRRNRALQHTTSPSGAGTAPVGSPGLFRWECDPSGEIAWVEGAPRGPLIGRSIARAQDSDGDRIGEEVARAFAMRAPFRDASISVAGEGPVAGEWKISGVPAFERADGRFAGYRGVALREMHAAPAPDALVQSLPDPDALRELVHEIKTPLNAIIGFAEIIDGQFLGPADRGYRERATEIVAQARLLLSAIDDLDFAAKVHSAGKGGRSRVNLGELVERMAPALRELAGKRGVELDASRTIRNLTIAVDPELADRVIFRMCSAMIERGQEGERLRLSVDRTGDQCRVSISRPRALRGLNDAQLFDLDTDASVSGGLSLRLVRGLAGIAGADLATSAASISLIFPRG